MNEEEKEAIEHLKEERKYAWDGDIIEIVLNYIDTLQEENKKYIDIFNSTEKIMNGQERTKDKLLKENIELQKENEQLTKRLEHLCKSDIVCSYDEVDINRNYKKDILTLDNNYISKDIIRTKIKELTGEIKRTKKGRIILKDIKRLAKIEVLKELLGE